jgi:glycosyltransferase involved in cell wall biosynthesis
MTKRIYDDVRGWLVQTAIFKRYQKIKSSKYYPKYSAIKTKANDRRQKSIVYLSPAYNVPSGGVKVIYNQVAIINSLKGRVEASVLHPLNPAFRCSWFAHDVTIKNNLELDQANDFVMVPEFLVVPQARLLHKLGVRYGIYVQGGYIFSRFSGEELDDAYHNAALILAISDDTEECIKLAFPECADKVHRVHCSVNPAKFIASSNKENIICYMPRRLERHAQLVTYFLNKKLPPHWKIVSIDGLSEDGVAEILGKSKIFLSFSELEGLSLPPIEAALSGCHVIGYTGEGAKEYWDREIFTEIHSGDIRSFVNAVMSKIAEIDGSPYVANTNAIDRLANRYSTRVELSDMQWVTNKVLEILNDVE